MAKRFIDAPPAEMERGEALVRTSPLRLVGVRSRLLIGTEAFRLGPLFLLLRHLRVFVVADVVEVEPADVHLVDGARTAADECGRIRIFLVRRSVVVPGD